MFRHMRQAAHREGGATIVEFALVAPVVILLLLACLDFARAMNAYVTVSNASREGARFATLHPAADPLTIQSSVLARVLPLDTSVMTVEAWYDTGSGFQRWGTGGIPATPLMPAPVSVRVEVTYPWSASTSIVGSFFSAAGSRSFASSSSMVTVR